MLTTLSNSNNLPKKTEAGHTGACLNPSFWEAEAGRLQVQGLPVLQGEFKASLHNIVRLS